MILSMKILWQLKWSWHHKMFCSTRSTGSSVMMAQKGQHPSQRRELEQNLWVKRTGLNSAFSLIILQHHLCCFVPAILPLSWSQARSIRAVTSDWKYDITGNLFRKSKSSWSHLTVFFILTHTHTQSFFPSAIPWSRITLRTFFLTIDFCT